MADSVTVNGVMGNGCRVIVIMNGTIMVNRIIINGEMGVRVNGE